LSIFAGFLQCCGVLCCFFLRGQSLQGLTLQKTPQNKASKHRPDMDTMGMAANLSDAHLSRGYSHYISSCHKYQDDVTKLRGEHIRLFEFFSLVFCRHTASTPICLFVCLFVVIKPRKLYSASYVMREVNPLGVITHGRAEAQTTCVPKTAAHTTYVSIYG